MNATQTPYRYRYSTPPNHKIRTPWSLPVPFPSLRARAQNGQCHESIARECIAATTAATVKSGGLFA